MTPKDYLGSYRLYLRGKVDSEMVESFDQQLDSYLRNESESDRSVTIVITSTGGGGDAARALHERIRLMANEVAVNILAVGECSSAAAIIYVAVERERRFTTPLTHFLLHESSRSKQEICCGTISQRDAELPYVQRSQDWMRREYDLVVKLLADACGQSETELKSLQNPGFDLVGAEAVEFGLAGGMLLG